jgi:hypothetical protein
LTKDQAEIIEESGYNKNKIINRFSTQWWPKLRRPYFSRDGYTIDKVKVIQNKMLQKKTTDDELEELISNISKFSNAQSRVPVDLIASKFTPVKIKLMKVL